MLKGNGKNRRRRSNGGTAPRFPDLRRPVPPRVDPDAGREKEVVGGQIRADLAGLSADDVRKLVVAYEPVWAIGTGLAATGPDANKVIADYIRKPYASMYGEEAAQAIRVLYGGSVKGNNAAEFFGQPDIDGALVGGASLKAPDFTDIGKAAAM